MSSVVIDYILKRNQKDNRLKMFKIISEHNLKKLNKVAVDILVRNVNVLLKIQDYVILGIPGGKSVSGIFTLLKNEERIPWTRVHIFMVDERLVPLFSEESNFKLAKDLFINNLIEKNLLPKENVHAFITKEKPDFGLSDYENELRRYGKNYDILILSAGEDGHIASLFPDHDSIKDNSEGYLLVKNSPKLPRKRVTISRKMILKSKIVMLLFLGKGKKQAYKNFLDNRNDFCSCPAKFVKNVENLYVLTSLNKP